MCLVLTLNHGFRRLVPHYLYVTRRFRKYSINHDFLENGVISHQHAWFWGMFLSDGSLCCPHKANKQEMIGWYQKYDSYPMLETLRSVCESTHPITFDGRDGKYFSCSLSLCSVKLAQQARTMLGCDANRKTFDLSFPTGIEDIYLAAMIR
eukprot:648918_1